MPITLLDIVLILVMLISGLLAMVRGFMREVLSITAWILAAVATLYSYGKLVPLAKQYFNSDIVAAIAVVALTAIVIREVRGLARLAAIEKLHRRATTTLISDDRTEQSIASHAHR